MTDTQQKQIKARPILFSAEMVRAILAGRKKQTRRVINPQPNAWVGRTQERVGVPYKSTQKKPHKNLFIWEEDNGDRYEPIKCPYGQPGDRLYVRETWANLNADFPTVAPHFVYRADNQDHGPVTWRPSIHMPRAASRIILEITDIRVERVQDISEPDAMAEGCAMLAKHPGNDGWISAHKGVTPTLEEGYSYREGFLFLWQVIYGMDSLKSNPWVWAITFKRIQPCP